MLHQTLGFIYIALFVYFVVGMIDPKKIKFISKKEKGGTRVGVFLKTIALFFGFTIAVAILQGCPSEQNNTYQQTSINTSDAPTQDIETTAQVRDLVKIGDSDWIVLGAEKHKAIRSNNQFIDPPTTTGHFVRVRYRVTNKTNKEERLFAGVEIVDDMGRRYRSHDQASFMIPERAKTINIESLPSGITKEFWDVFEVAENSKNISFVARNISGFARKEVKINLGF